MTDSSDHAKTVQGSRLGVALFLFRATFSFSPSRPLIGEVSKKEKFPLACVCTRVSTNQYIYFFLFFFYFFFIKRKVSEEMPFNSELWVRNSNNFRKNVLIFRRNKNKFGKNSYKWVRNFARKTAKNAPKSACF